MSMSRKLALIPFTILIAIVALTLIFPGIPAAVYAGPELNSGDTAWMITATALVLFMTPGLAFFYGGMVRKKNVISTMAQSFIAMAVVSIVWVVVGFSLAFGDSIGGIIGNRLDPALRVALDERATEEGKPASEVVREALRQYLAAS